MLETLQNKNNLIAIVGASNDPKKYGNKILLDLISKGHNVAPINLNPVYLWLRADYYYCFYYGYTTSNTILSNDPHDPPCVLLFFSSICLSQPAPPDVKAKKQWD